MILDDYEITEYKQIVQIKADWEALYALHNTSYCQSYNFMSYIERFCQENVFKKLFWGKLRYIQISKNNEYSEKLISISNDIIVHDLIKKNKDLVDPKGEDKK